MTLRVLLLDEGFMSGALAAIGLRDAGCEVDVVAAVGGRGTCRMPRLRWHLGPDCADPSLDAFVARIVAEREIDVIYPVTEPLQARYTAVVAPAPARVFQPVDSVHHALLGDKAALSAALAAGGVAIPAQRPLTADDDGMRAVAALGLPLVVKGIRGRGGSTTTICSDTAAVQPAIARLRTRGIPAFAQQYVHGQTLLVGGTFHDGVPLCLYAGVKTVQHPRRTGPAVEIRGVRDADAIAMALRGFAMLGFTGVGSVDVVRGAAGVRFLELNPRPWGSIAAAHAAGVDCFTPLASLLAGESPAPAVRIATCGTERVLPLYLLADPWRRHPITALRALAADIRSPQGEPWRHPAQAWHLLRRLQHVGRRWEG